MAQLTFDASGVEPDAPRALLPPDRYPVQIVQSEMRPTKAGDGQMLWLEMDVIDGPYRGRKIWDQLNLVNRSTVTVEIAQRRLSAICHAIGQVQVSDSEQLHFKTILCTVKVKPAGTDKFGIDREAKNDVAGYEPTGAGAVVGSAVRLTRPTSPAQAPRAPASAPVMPPRPAAAPAMPPWRRQA